MQTMLTLLLALMMIPLPQLQVLNYAKKPCLGQAGTKDAKSLVQASLTAMGGEEKIRALRSVLSEGVGYRNAIEQSERPEGPWIFSSEQMVEYRDLQHNRIRRNLAVQWNGRTSNRSFLLSDGIMTSPEVEEWLALAPEKVLLAALDSPDLKMAGETVLQAVPHQKVSFTWKKTLVFIYLNQYTHLPTAVELTRPYTPNFYNVWGDVTTRTLYSFWTLEPGGIHYPRQWNVEHNGQPAEAMFLTKVELNATLPEEPFVVSEAMKAAYKRQLEAKEKGIQLDGPNRPPIQEIVSGIVQIPGTNSTIIRQDDGLVILDTPVSSAYSVKVIEEAERRFPGVPIKAAITTSDAWLHCGGVREYVARGVPIYALDINQPILQRLIDAPYHTNPDNLARNPKKPKFQLVSSKTIVGKGANRVEIYPIHSEGGERMLMAYFPEHKLLYATDLIQTFRPEPWSVQFISEVVDAVKRENLVVETGFAMHLTPFPWTKALEAIAQGTASTAPKTN